MDCKETQALIPDYVKGTISPKKMAEFIRHVKGCEQCKEELEIFFITFTAIQRLDNEDASYDLTGMLERDLEEKEKILRRKKRSERLLITLFVLLAFIFIIWWI